MIEPAEADKLISDRITEAIGTDADVIPAVAASQLVAELLESDPDLLRVWLDAHAEAFLRDAITARIRSVRARSRAHASAGAFGRAAKRFSETGDVAVLSPFEVRYVVDGHDTQRRVADMTREDCLFVADRYATTGRRMQMLAAFHKAVGNKIQDRTVGEVFSETQYDALYRSITGQPTSVVVPAAS